jgi:hypothetical protein
MLALAQGRPAIKQHSSSALWKFALNLNLAKSLKVNGHDVRPWVEAGILQAEDMAAVRASFLAALAAGAARLPDPRVEGRGLHSCTFRLNLSTFCGIGVHVGVV